MNTAERQRAWGLRIKALRKATGLTQEELATAVGVSTDMIGSIEQGRAWTTFGNLVALASALEVSVAQLFEIPTSHTQGAARTKDAFAGEMTKMGHLLSPESRSVILAVAKQLRKAERR